MKHGVNWFEGSDQRHVLPFSHAVPLRLWLFLPQFDQLKLQLHGGHVQRPEFTVAKGCLLVVEVQTLANMNAIDSKGPFSFVLGSSSTAISTQVQGSVYLTTQV